MTNKLIANTNKTTKISTLSVGDAFLYNELLYIITEVNKNNFNKDLYTSMLVVKRKLFLFVDSVEVRPISYEIIITGD